MNFYKILYVLLIVASFVGGIVGSFIFHRKRPKDSDGTFGFEKRNGRTVLILNLESPIAVIAKRGYAVFKVDERHKFEEGFEDSRDV